MGEGRRAERDWEAQPDKARYACGHWGQFRFPLVVLERKSIQRTPCPRCRDKWIQRGLCATGLPPVKYRERKPRK